MDELSEKLAGILNDPESMQRVRTMAESLLGGKEEQPSPKSENLFGEGMPSPDELKMIMGILSRLKSGENDRRTQLLLALKPNLSEPKQEKVDTAVKILKVIELLPYLKESGLLNFLNL